MIDMTGEAIDITRASKVEQRTSAWMGRGRFGGELSVETDGWL